MKKVSYGGWPNCVRLSNGKIELIATTDVGPRIIRLGFVGGANLMKEFDGQMGLTGGDEWRIYGGHRFWHAPELDPRSYAPDNEPVAYSYKSGVLTLTQPVEKTTGIVKKVRITLDPKANRVRVVHTLTNKNLWDVEAGCWGLTVMSQGGRAIFPQEEFRPHPEYLLPARPLVLWHYTDMSDPRWRWGKRYIQLTQDPAARTKTKAGMRNSLGWAAYYLKGDLFVKKFPVKAGAKYPDFGCNCESYTDSDMIEIESLGPLLTIPAGKSISHTEDWYLHKAKLSTSEAAIDRVLGPLVK